MNKLNVINKIKVVDYSCSDGELEYVLIADTEKNKEILKTLGMTELDYKEMYPEDGALDITVFAVDKLGAVGWHREHGFLTYEQAKELNLEWF